MSEGYFWLTAPCCACGKIITCNPARVPSLTVGGHRRPLCLGCYARWNEIHRTSKGLEPIPLMDGAYEPCPESEL